jgi:hypothetical protein
MNEMINVLDGNVCGLKNEQRVKINKEGWENLPW